ncbi:MAG: hypoxanthine-guanine phosphoribosyltransferase [Gammaproteobacteria bacterium]|nr:hypoxanthine-guanine phosphoribosyltransferase [Gammaproteobacteria bacterium]
MELSAANKILSEAECLFSADQVSLALDAVAKKMHKHYFDKNPLVLCVMKGGAFTACALLQRLQFPLEFDFIQVTRYRNTTQGGEIEWRVKPNADIAGRHVLIIDDILDEGVTLQAITEYCKKENAASFKVAVLTVKKRSGAGSGIQADYVALEIPDRYVFGCGMDYQGYFRNMNGIYALPDSE